jgi:hypothetical protein
MPLEAGVSLTYTGTSDILLCRPASGRPYSFSAAEPLRPVDRRDVGALLRTGLFRRD